MLVLLTTQKVGNIQNSMREDRAHVHESGAVLILTGDSGHEKGGTRELKVSGDVHSPHKNT